MNNRDKRPRLPNPEPAAGTQAPIRLASWLVTRAARQAPAELAARLEEEWLADLGTRHGALSQLLFALGCGWATQVIAHDSWVLGARARGVMGGHGTLTAFAPAELSPGAGRPTVVMLVVALHVVVIYAFLAGIIHQPGTKAQPPVIPARMLADPRPKPTALPGPTVDLTASHLKIPTVDPIIDIRQQSAQGIPDFGGVTMGTETPRPIARVTGGPGAGFPSTDIFYPAASIRAQEAGPVSVRVCVDERGRLVGDPSIASTSGFPRLDRGALELARAGSGHYRSTTEDGKPVSSCFAYRVRFQIH